MVIDWLERENAGANPGLGTASAWKCVEEMQLHPQLPCLLVSQPAHAVLAGHLAGGLLGNCFGDLPGEVKQAILMHDTGWAMIDASQIQWLRSGSSGADRAIPVSFISNSPREVSGAWTASIRSVECMSPVGGLIVSRHFTLLAAASGQVHHEFLAAESTRQRKLAAGGLAAEIDLERWTAALGFCDLVSLYLITGLKGETSFPLAHPASPQAQMASRVSLQFEENRLRWIPRIFPPRFHAELEALIHPVRVHDSRSERLSWDVI